MDVFCTALKLYTRIPCPKSNGTSQSNINKAIRFFPLIGWIVGGLSFLLFYATFFLLNVEIAVFVSLIAGVLLTGGIHEVGLSNVFDRLAKDFKEGRGAETEKNKRIGVFGGVALLLVLALKYFSLYQIITYIGLENRGLIALIFISYHSIARLVALNFFFTTTYSQANRLSKVKTIAKDYPFKDVELAYLFGLLPLAALSFYDWKYWLILIPLFFVYYLSKRLYEKCLDGFTEDCLGATQQIAECATLIAYLMIWKFM